MLHRAENGRWLGHRRRIASVVLGLSCVGTLGCGGGDEVSRSVPAATSSDTHTHDHVVRDDVLRADAVGDDAVHGDAVGADVVGADAVHGDAVGADVLHGAVGPGDGAHGDEGHDLDAPEDDDERSVLTVPHVREPPAIDGALGDPAWRAARVVRIATDYAGRPAGLATDVRLVWTDDALFVAFDCAYDELVVDPDADTEIEHPRLYQFDVVEIFLDDDPESPATYREIEIGPRGHVLDVRVDRDARPRGDVAWSSAVVRATRVDKTAKRFTIEARVPATAFDRDHLAVGEWRVGLYRIAGRTPDRTYLAAFPTLTERPNFHVPDRFGRMRLVR